MNEEKHDGNSDKVSGVDDSECNASFWTGNMIDISLKSELGAALLERQNSPSIDHLQSGIECEAGAMMPFEFFGAVKFPVVFKIAALS
jgi:hypothetical protein